MVIIALTVFKCILCGEYCCTFREEVEMPLVFPWEKRRLSRLRKDLVFKPYMVYRVKRKRYAVLLYRWIINGKCPFLSSDGKCMIHEDKPLSCKIFPLVIGLDDNTLRVSMACKVISENPDNYRGDPSTVFPLEYPYALKTFMILKLVDRIASINNWKREIVEGDVKGELIDIDELVDIEELLNNINESLAKYVEKQA